MFIKILLGLIVVLGLILIVGAFQPPDYRVVRSVTVAAPAATVFAHVNDFHRWQDWSPWAKLDPTMKETYAGAAAGTGAAYAWTGNAQVGEGRMTIVESVPGQRVRVNLEFIKPFPAPATAEFTFRPEGDKTVVTWTMDGKKVFVTKVVGLFVSMDKILGGEFEKGLAQLKTVAQSTSVAAR